MRRFGFWISLIGLSFIALSVYGYDNFWQKKDYHKWTEKECREVMENSPWAKRTGTAAVTSRLISSGTNDSGGGQNVSQSTSIAPIDSVSSGRAADQQVSYIVQLRSAVPVRQAVVRERLIAVKADEQPPDKKQAYEQQAEQFVSARLGDVVLVHVIYSTNVNQWDRVMANYWQHQTVDTLKTSFFLIGAHGRVAPVDFQAVPGAGREFEVTFPRTSNGEPLVGPAEKQLSVEFMHPAMSEQVSENAARGRRAAAPSANNKEQRMLVEFKVKDMVQDGKVIY